MGLGGPAGRYLLLQQLPTGVDVAVSGGSFRGNDLTGSLYVNGSVALRLNRFLRSRLVRLRRDGLVRDFLGGKVSFPPSSPSYIEPGRVVGVIVGLISPPPMPPVPPEP